MTELKMIVTDSNNKSVEQLLKNERDFKDIQIQIEIDNYIHNYINFFNKENFKNNTKVKSIEMYYMDTLIRKIVTNENDENKL